MATINGSNNSDFLNGTESADLILGRKGKDVLLGNGGEDTLKGGGGKDTLDGGTADDEIFGQGGDDEIRGSAGNDFIDGGGKFDTADYSRLSQAITLEAAGSINKGSIGTDRILNVERIVGAAGQNNLIDGSTGVSSATSFRVNLENESLRVKNVPGIGNLDFDVENFVNVIGTSQNDRIKGSSNNNFLEGNRGADTFIATAGDDTIAGNRGSGVDDGSNDTIDYNKLNVPITLNPTGTINKGSAGTDQLIRVETIVGASSQENTIDASSADASIDVDLAAETLEVDIPVIGTLERTVTNFTDVIGSTQADSISDNGDDNFIDGGRGRDTLESSIGNDTIIGGGGRDTIIADLGQDELTGGAGADTFVLRDGNNISFSDAGNSDRAFISDFTSGQDTIELAGDPSLYVSFSNGSNSRLAIDSDFDGTFDFNSDELIASINGSFDFDNDVVFS